jgi:hypothetical protein
MSNINESLRDWIESEQSDYAILEGLTLVTMGETDDLEPPFLGIYETGSDMRETNGVIIPGVSDYQITCELHTVPADEAEGGTSPEHEREMRAALYDIIGDRAAIAYITALAEWTVFDIRLAGPTTEAGDGRRVTRWTLQITACPN